MNAVKLACGIAVAAIVVGPALGRVSPSQWRALLGSPSAKLAAPRGEPALANVAMDRPVVTGLQPRPGASNGGSVTLSPDRFGQYHAEMEVEGRRVPVLIDTGASVVSLSYETAAELGYFPAPADFTWHMRTANGVTSAAPIEIAEVRVGPIVARHVKAVVSQRGALTDTLLGMSFLRELGGFSIDGGRLVLKQ